MTQVAGMGEMRRQESKETTKKKFAFVIELLTPHQRHDEGVHVKNEWFSPLAALAKCDICTLPATTQPTLHLSTHLIQPLHPIPWAPSLETAQRASHA